MVYCTVGGSVLWSPDLSTQGPRREPAEEGSLPRALPKKSADGAVELRASQGPSVPAAAVEGASAPSICSSIEGTGSQPQGGFLLSLPLRTMGPSEGPELAGNRGMKVREERPTGTQSASLPL